MRHLQTIKSTTLSFINGLVKQLAFLLFSQNPILGWVILILLFSQPFMVLNVLLSYSLTLVLDTCLGRAASISFVEQMKNKSVNHFYAYNSLLVAILLSNIFEPSLFSLLYIGVMSCAAYVLSIVLSWILWYNFSLPILNLSFSIMAIIAHLSMSGYSNLLYRYHYWEPYAFEYYIPQWVRHFFESLGTLIFLPHFLVGLILFVVLIWASRINAFLSLYGYMIGCGFSFILKGSFEQSFNSPYAFNYILIALALGGLFLIPSVFSYGIVFISILMSVPFTDATSSFWESYSIPVFTLPFLGMTFSVYYMLFIYGHPLITKVFLKSPEANLNYHHTYQQRFPMDLPVIELPVSGDWTIYQEAYGQWTHKGPWSIALDFVLKSNQSTYLQEGLELEDYHCFGKPVLSPIQGVVIHASDVLPDLPIGEVDKLNNWGNFIIIEMNHLGKNYYVELSHLKMGSLQVSVGSWVAAGQLIAYCGNSGYSPEPHLHLQVQALPTLGSPSVNFRLHHLFKNEQFEFGVKATEFAQADQVQSYTPSKSESKDWQYILDEVHQYELYKNGQLIEQIQVKVALNHSGEYYLTPIDATGVTYNVRLFFTKTSHSFYFYRYEGEMHFLSQWFICFPRLVLSDQAISWTDQLESFHTQYWLKDSNWGFHKLRTFIFEDFLKSLFPSKVGATAELIKRGRILKNNIKYRWIHSTIEANAEVQWRRSEGIQQIDLLTQSNKYSWRRV